MLESQISQKNKSAQCWNFCHYWISLMALMILCLVYFMLFRKKPTLLIRNLQSNRITLNNLFCSSFSLYSFIYPFRLQVLSSKNGLLDVKTAHFYYFVITKISTFFRPMLAQ